MPAVDRAGAVAVDPLPEAALRRALCGHDGRPTDGTARLMPPPLPFSVELIASTDAGQATHTLVARLAAVRHDVQVTDRPEKPAAALLAGVGRAGHPRQDDALGDLPLIELPAPGPGTGAFAILYSGDGGWRDLDKDVAALLQREGLPVVGVDVLRYFWSALPFLTGNLFFKHKGHDGHKGKPKESRLFFLPLCTLCPSW